MADSPDNSGSGSELHKNPDWLREKYHGEGLSLNDIADLVDRSYTAVWEQFDKHDRPRRDNANHVELTDQLRRLLDGLLAGDGCLYPENKAAYYLHGDSYKAFVDWLEDVLDSHGVETISRWTTEGDTGWEAYHLRTRAYRELLGVEGRWYADRKKRLPPDFELSPTTLLMWYIGDGSYIPQRWGENNVILYSDTFVDEKERVEGLLADEVGVNATYMQKGVYIPANDHERFFNYMAQSPLDPPGYEDKFP